MQPDNNSAITQRVSLINEELRAELSEILHYWLRTTEDPHRGGFYGSVDNDNRVGAESPKGSVLNSRILWSFSAAYNYSPDPEYLVAARRAYEYLVTFFIDKDYGGLYWTVDCAGKPLDTKKQMYALAFAVYGLSEYYRASGDPSSLDQAKGLYHLIVEKSYDPDFGGYIEAFSRGWGEMQELRLSEKDANEKKSMNTHLHILEGFAGLYRAWPDEGLRRRIIELIHLFLDHIMDPGTGHLVLFFDMHWNSRSTLVSFGHDIEASWLLQEAAQVAGEPQLLKKVKAAGIKMARAACRGLDQDGGLWYEYDPETNVLVREKHSWPQAEGMVGFYNAWQLTGEEGFLDKTWRSWQFVKEHIKDHRYGEWFWGVRQDGSVMDKDKVGLWKCPYHNSRACLELIRRTGEYVKGAI